MTDSSDMPTNPTSGSNALPERPRKHWKHRTNAEIAELHAAIWQASVDGMTVRQIAARFEMSVGGVHYVLQEKAREVQARPLAEHRQRASERLDLMYAVARRVVEDALGELHAAMSSDDPAIAEARSAAAYENLLKAQMAMGRAIDLDAKIFGYAAPARSEVTVNEISDEEWQQRKQAVQDELRARRLGKGKAS